MAEPLAHYTKRFHDRTRAKSVADPASAIGTELAGLWTVCLGLAEYTNRLENRVARLERALRTVGHF